MEKFNEKKHNRDLNDLFTHLTDKESKIIGFF